MPTSICASCGTEFRVKPSLVGIKLACSLRCRPKREKQPISERFWPRVVKGDGCWLWTGYRDRKGYGFLGAGTERGKTALAHRVAWELTYGTIDGDLCILHRCDNPSCVRPDHLFIGTRGDNNEDMWQKGRGVSPPRQPTLTERARGTRHGNAILTESAVEEIRQKYASGNVSQTALAAEYGVSQRTISRVVRREGWIIP